MKVNIYSLHKLSDLPKHVKDYLYEQEIIEGDEENFELCHQVLLVEDRGVFIACETDNMEPEDATFTRDLSWIPEIIEKAFHLGMEHGYSKAVEDSLIPTLHE